MHSFLRCNLRFLGRATICIIITFFLVHVRFNKNTENKDYHLQVKNAYNVRFIHNKSQYHHVFETEKLPCDEVYQQLSHLDFLKPLISSNVCENIHAFSVQDGVFPICVFKDSLNFNKLSKFVKARLRSSLLKREIPFYTYSAKDKFISKTILTTKLWENEIVTTLINATLRIPAVTFLDVGSNIGVYSVQAVLAGLPIVALDANIRNLLCFRRSLEANLVKEQNYVLLWNFIGLRPTLIYLHLPSDCNVGGAAFGESSSDFDLSDTIPVMSIQSWQLREVIHTRNAVIKLDIETGEFSFFRYAQPLFAEFNIVIIQMEWTIPKLQKYIKRRRFIANFLSSMNYRPYGVTTNFNVTLMDLNEWKSWPATEIIWVKNPSYFQPNNAHFVYRTS